MPLNPSRLPRVLGDHLKNIGGWSSRQRLVAFAVDDYGNVRVGSADAARRLEVAGISLGHYMDRLDTLETTSDLENLFNVLDRFRDRTGRPPVITAYTLTANPDFAFLRSGFHDYRYLNLQETFDYFGSRHPNNYGRTWDLWREGIARGLIFPQFHGREHFNLQVLKLKLERNSRDLLVNLENDSLAGLTSESELPGLHYTRAFAWNSATDLGLHAGYLQSGLSLFEQLFGFRSLTFAPPALTLHPSLQPVLFDEGVRAIDRNRVEFVDGQGKTRNRLGQKTSSNLVTLVRNVVFEPTTSPDNAVARALQQIEAAFFWNKPAIISSHRVNFCGQIDESNRSRGLNALQALLNQILTRWPDTQFVTTADLTQQIMATS
jgi:hypothetical protein